VDFVEMRVAAGKSVALTEASTVFQVVVKRLGCSRGTVEVSDSGDALRVDPSRLW
jgi:hypothetical protein